MLLFLPFAYQFPTDSCKTAKCGARKKCVIRSGEPRCVCAPKCKTKNRPKRGHRHVQSQLLHLQSHSHSHSQSQLRSNNHEELNQQQQQQSGDFSNRTLINNPSGNNHHHQSIQIDAATAATASDDDDEDDTSHDVQIFHGDNLNNRPNMKSDKIISIIAPSIQHSNLSRSHRRNKKTSLHNSAMTHNGKRNVAKPTKPSNYSVAVPSNNSHAKQQPNGIHSNKHKLAHKNQYTNSSGQLDNNIFNVNHHRRQTSSVEEQFKSKFYGHDIPYPPIDLPVSAKTEKKKTK